MEKDCRECSLPIHPYKQVIQEDPDLCECCVLIQLGVEDWKFLEEQEQLLSMDLEIKLRECSNV